MKVGNKLLDACIEWVNLIRLG